MTQQTPLMFWGNESFSTCPDYDQAPILTALIDAGWPIQAIIIKHQQAVSRRQAIPTVSRLADLHGLELIIVDADTNLETIVSRYQPQLGILASFGLLLPQAVLDCFSLGLINVHPSLLPSGRGPTPIEATISSGLDQTGVSLIQTVVGLDAGPIYAQKAIDINPQITKLELTSRIGQLAADLVIDTLPKIASGQIEPRDQDQTQVSWTRALSIKDRPLDWQKPALELERQIRAQSDWPGSTTVLSGQLVKIIEAVVYSPDPAGQPGQVRFNAQNQLIVVDCQPGQLGLKRLQIPGRQTLSASEFYNGYGLG